MKIERRILSFLAMAFGFSWSVAGIGAFFGVRASSGGAYMSIAALCMLGPALAALVQHRLIDRAPWSALGLHPNLIRWRALPWTLLIGLSIIPVCLLVVHGLGDVLGLPRFGHVAVTGERFLISLKELMSGMGVAEASSKATEFLSSLPGAGILLAILLSALVMAFSFNLPFMLGEELGWRGYLYEATIGWNGFRRVLFTGVCWGLWHAPLIAMGHNYPGYPLIGIGMMVVFCVLLAFLFDWSRWRTNSVWGPSVLHGLINGSAGAMALFAWDGHVLVASPVGVGGILAIALLVVLVLLSDFRYRKALTNSAGEFRAAL